MSQPAGPSTTPAPTISRERIEATERRIRAYVRRTPVLEVAGADFGLGSIRLVFKLESLQIGGSFKSRGAFANLLSRDVPPAGVVAASGGNHGVAVALAAQALGRPARIFVPRISSPAKLERIRGAGAELVVIGERYADALAASIEWAAQSGAMPVHAYDQVETMLGQGSVGVELERQEPRLDTLLVPVGGGGLIGGLAAWDGGAVRIVGAEPEAAPTLSEALRAGQPVDVPVGGLAADSLGATRTGALVLPLAKARVDRVVLVPDAAIREAQQALWRTLRVVAEPGGATSFAALLSGQYAAREGERIGVIVSGGNTTSVEFDPWPPPSH
jgi:threonine dehydratase